MKLIRHFFSPKEARLVIGALEEIQFVLNNPDFRIVQKRIEDSIYKDADFKGTFNKYQLPPRIFALRMIANIAEKLLISGEYHIYRGVLNPMGPGNNLVKIFSEALIELMKAGDMSINATESWRFALRASIADAG